ncbi:MAG: lipoate--protein ligase [Thermosediminibacteraceae bacterium]|nr:lipoate--protein ligase [Thermosediminibacteraceae bacterium]
MLYIYNKSTNPYFNLAAEEYLLKEFSEEIFMLWRNEPSVIIGKNQNALAEIDIDYVKKNNIPVVRRLSGGGAVFHDLGNLNFTFIVNDDISHFADFKKFTEPIIEVLKKLSIDAEFSGRNDITIGGKKISGNAQYCYKKRILHHGTLLFSASIRDLSSALKSKAIKFEDKAVKSVEKRVTNISEHLKEPLTIEEFIDLIMDHIKERRKEGKVYEFTPEDIRNIERLVKEKYGTWEWNFGESPNYKFKNEKKFPGGTVEVNMNVERGIIKDIKFYGDFFGRNDIAEIEELLKGVRHEEEELRKAFCRVNISDYFAGITVDELVSLFF